MDLARLPPIVDVLHVGTTPCFVVLEYAPFVRYVAATAAEQAPHVVSILDRDGEHVFAVLPMNSFVAYVNMVGVEGEIDEPQYLAAYPDVQAAVARGQLPSASHHYRIAGYFERRAARWYRAG